MILALVIGAFIGAAIQPCSVVCAGSLLKSRHKFLTISTRERVFTCIVLACFGVGIGLCAQAVPTACFLFALLLVASIAAIIDFHERLIPNELVLLLFVVRLAFGIPALLGVAGFPGFDLASSALGCLACGAIFAVPGLLGKQVGAGDIKFAAAMGFCLGFTLSMYALGLMGILVFAYMLYGRRLPFAERLKQLVPMAPFLCVAMMVVLLVQMSPAVLV